MSSISLINRIATCSPGLVLGRLFWTGTVFADVS